MVSISRSKLQVIASLILLTATGYIVVVYGQSAYFVAFHKPLHLSLTHTPVRYTPPSLPTFHVQPAVSAHSLSHGSTQDITVSLSSNRIVSGYIEVWIESPEHRQVFKSPSDGAPVQFLKDKAQIFSYKYTMPRSLPSGTYKASVIVTSANQQTDYYVDINFATFTLS